MKSKALCRKTRSGFTLVELLVVVSIIALLVAILLPSLSKARQQAKRLACLANIRGIAQASLTYSSDDRNENSIPVAQGDGTYPKSHLSYAGFGGRSGRGATKNANNSSWSGRQTIEIGSQHRPLNYVLYKGLNRISGAFADWNKDAEIEMPNFMCPSDKGFSGMHMKGWKDSKLSAFDYYGTSYFANPLFVAAANEPTYKSNSMYRRPLSRVPNPGNTIMYTELAARYAFFANNTEEYDQSVPGCFWPYDIGNYVAKGFHKKDWHFNAAFGDGHASWIKIKGFGGVDIPQNNMPPECPNGICVCILVRGLGWQLDTLPADLILTTKGKNSSTVISTTDGSSANEFEVVNF
ncbi:MAG TPA: type II secretion system protein [Phycisphaerae bacterium]|nr:type II secretion system protein [Phycisphaerae bacterium]